MEKEQNEKSVLNQQMGRQVRRRKQFVDNVVRRKWIRIFFGFVLLIPLPVLLIDLIIHPEGGFRSGRNPVNMFLGAGVFFFMGSTLVAELFHKPPRHKK